MVDRRTFLRASALAATAASYSRILGANDRIRLGVVGCGNRGYYMMTMFQKCPEIEVAWVCDVYGQKADHAAEAAPGAAKTGDHHAVMNDHSVDAILVTTPDHWHVPITIDAMNAGKDVYVEKPLTFRPGEGPAVIQAASATRRICQVGLQQRSGDLFLRAKREIFDSGLIGKVSMVESVWHYSAPYDLGDPHQPKPPDLDWNRFLGQVPWRPWNPHQYNNYRLFLDFGGAAMTDLLTHWIDVVHMLLGEDSPKQVSAVGGIYVARDDRTAPDTVNVIANYHGFTVSFASASLDGMPLEHLSFLGSNGVLWISRRRYQFTPKEAGAKPLVFQPPEDTLVQSHIRNFLDCCRSRNTPTCPPAIGERASRMCLQATESYVQKRQILST